MHYHVYPSHMFPMQLISLKPSSYEEDITFYTLFQTWEFKKNYNHCTTTVGTTDVVGD